MLRSHSWSAFDKHTRSLCVCDCVCACVDDYHHSVHRFAKHASRGKAITRTRQTSGKCTASTKICQINWAWEEYDKYSLGSLYNARLYWCICQIHKQWEQHDKYSLSSLYNARLYWCVCQIHKQWEQYDKYSLGSLNNAPLY